MNLRAFAGKRRTRPAHLKFGIWVKSQVSNLATRFRHQNRVKASKPKAGISPALGARFREKSRRQRVSHLPQNIGALDFGFHFSAKKIHQNLYPLFG
jgi:hypothetical protein